MKHINVFLLFLIISFLVSAQNTSEAYTQITKSYTTHRLTSSRPVIDGKLNDKCWENNNWAGNFIQWIPNEGAEPAYPTYINILYDDKNIYVAIRAIDNEPDKISRKASRRDQLAGDMVGINFDSYHDFRTGFEFNVTAAGQKIDLILTNPMEADKNWDAVWTAKVGMEDSAWVAEYEIPLSQLRYSNEKEQTWGLHAWRWIDRFQEESDWEPQSSTGPGMLYQFGILKGISDLPKSRRLEIMPYVLGRTISVEKDVTNPYAQNSFRPYGSIGLDAKIGLSSNFTADVTINPDFGQVESDPSVMNLSVFETFYNEKRPFFLEGKNIFDFSFDGSNLFYSRRIGHSPGYKPNLNDNEYMHYPTNTSILEATKVSGKTSNGLSLGILQCVTNSERAKISNGENERRELVEPMTNYTMARVQKDFNSGTTVLGGIITSTNRFLTVPQFDYINKNAITGGIDFLHQWNDKEFYIDAKWIVSNIQGDKEAISILQKSSARFYQRPDAEHLNFNPELTTLSGQGGTIKIGKGSKGRWRYSSNVSWRSPGLDLNDMGYMQTADQITNSNSLSYFINQPVGKLRSLNVSVFQNNTWDYALNYKQAHFNASFNSQFLNKWSINTHICHFPESIDTRKLRGGYAMKVPVSTHGTIGLSSDHSKKAAFSVSSYLENGRQNSKNAYTLNADCSYQPINTLKFSVSFEYSENNDELQYVPSNTALAIEDQNHILGRIDQKTLGATFRVDYNITPELSIQYYGSPYASTGKFSNFKWVDDPMADQLENRYYSINPESVGSGEENDWYAFSNPDFTFTQFRSNLVFRWEYLPGSKLYIVWSNEKTNYQSVANSSIGDSFTGMNNAFANNVFLVKLNYWFSL